MSKIDKHIDDYNKNVDHHNHEVDVYNKLKLFFCFLAFVAAITLMFLYHV